MTTTLSNLRAGDLVRVPDCRFWQRVTAAEVGDMLGTPWAHLRLAEPEDARAEDYCGWPRMYSAPADFHVDHRPAAPTAAAPALAMNISATIVADSVNPHGHRLVSMICVYPRFIHSELMTHRQFSRNAASSRAIPVHRMIRAVESAPAMPVWWGRNQSGMQAAQELGPAEGALAVREWLDAAKDAVAHARRMAEIGAHKQIANRLLEPFQWMTTLVTASEWHNFFALRAHPDAQPEFQELAFQMLGAYLGSAPVARRWGEWHVPFGDRMPEGLDHATRLTDCTVEDNVASDPLFRTTSTSGVRVRGGTIRRNRAASLLSNPDAVRLDGTGLEQNRFTEGR